jgi:FKBP-type peptidyl-prolyl cis-trans isomerase FklB
MNMMLKSRISVLLSLCFLAVATSVSAEEAAALNTDRARTSYAIGLQTAKNLKKDAADVDMETIIQGLRDGFSGDRQLLSDKETKQLMQILMNDARQKMVANKREASVKNRLQGEEFLAANQGKEGVKVLPGGVQYRVIRAGSGPKPTDGDTVLCNYRGTLIDGAEFDATQANRPAPLKLAQMIPGFREALKAMQPGAKWQIFIPSALGYGERGVGNDVGPNQTLIFDVELLEIK